MSTDLGINVWNPESKSFEFLQLPNMANNKTLKGMVEDKRADFGYCMMIDFCVMIRQKKILHHQLSDYYRNEESVFKDLVCDENGRTYIFRPSTVFIVLIPTVLKHAPNDILITDLYVKRARLYPNDEFNILSENILTQTSIDVPYQYQT